MKSNSKQRSSPALSPRGQENHFRTYSSGSQNSNKEEKSNQKIKYQYQDEMQNLMDGISMPNQSMSMSNLSQISQSPFNGGTLTPSRATNFNVPSQIPQVANFSQHQTSSATKLSTFISQMQKSNHSQSQSSLQVSIQKKSTASNHFFNNIQFNQEIDQQMSKNNPQSFRSSQNVDQNVQKTNDQFLQNIEMDFGVKSIDNRNFNQNQNLNLNYDRLKFNYKNQPQQSSIKSNQFDQLNQKNRTFADSVLLQGMISKQQLKKKDDNLNVDEKIFADFKMKQEQASPLSAIRQQFGNFQENVDNQNLNVMSKADISGISNFTAITGAPKSIQFRMNIPKTPDRSEFSTSLKDERALSNQKNIQKQKQIAEINISDLGLSQIKAVSLEEKQDFQCTNNLLEKSDIGGLSDISGLYPNKSPFVMKFENNKEKEEDLQKGNEEDIELKEALSVQQNETNKKHDNLIQSPQKKMLSNIKDEHSNNFQTQELQKLRIELSLAKSELSKYKILISNKNQECNDVEIKNRKSQQMILDLENKIIEISDQCKMLQQSQKDHSQLPQFLSRAQENARKEIQILKQQMFEKDDNLKKLQKQLAFQQDNKILDDQCLIQQIQDLCTQIDSEKLISAGVKNNLSQYQKQFEEQEQLMNKNFDKENKVWIEKCKQMETYIQQIIKEYQEKEEELQQVLNKYSFIQSKEKEQKYQNEILNQEVENMKQRCIGLERDLEAKSNIDLNKSQQKDFEFELKKQRDLFTKQNCQLKEEKQSLQYQLNDYRNKYEQLNGNGLEDKILQYENQIQDQLSFISKVQDLIVNSQHLKSFQQSDNDLLICLQNIIQHAESYEINRNQLINIQEQYASIERESIDKQFLIESLQKDVVNLQKQVEQGPSSFTKNLLLEKDKEIQELKQELKSERIALKNIEEKLWHSQKNNEISNIKQEELNNGIAQLKLNLQNKEREGQAMADQFQMKEKQINEELKIQKDQVFELQKKENEQLKIESENMIQYVQLKNMFDQQLVQIDELKQRIEELQLPKEEQIKDIIKVLTRDISCQFNVHGEEKSVQTEDFQIDSHNKEQSKSDIEQESQIHQDLQKQIKELQQENQSQKQVHLMEKNEIFQNNALEMIELKSQLQKLKDLNFELSKELKNHLSKIQIQNLEAVQLQQQVQMLQENEQNLIRNFNIKKSQGSQQYTQTEQSKIVFIDIFEQMQKSIKESKKNLNFVNQYVFLNTIIHGYSKQMRLMSSIFYKQIESYDILQWIQITDFSLISQNQSKLIQDALFFFLSSAYNMNSLKVQKLKQEEQDDLIAEVLIKNEEIQNLSFEMQKLQCQLDEQKEQDHLLKEEFKQIVEGLENQKELLEKEYESKLYKCKKETEIEFKIKLKEQQQVLQSKIEDIQTQTQVQNLSQLEKVQKEKEQLQIELQKQVQEYQVKIETLEDELSYQKQKELAQKDIDNFKQQQAINLNKDELNSLNGIVKFETILDLEFQKILLSLKMKSQNMSIEQLNQKRDQLNKNIQKILNEEVLDAHPKLGIQLKKSMDNIKKNMSEVLKLFKESLEGKSLKKIQEYEFEINRLNKLFEKQSFQFEKQRNEPQSVSINEIKIKFFQEFQDMHQAIKSSKFFKICVQNNLENEDFDILNNIKPLDANCDQFETNYNQIKDLIFKYFDILNQGAEFFENEISNLNQMNCEMQDKQIHEQKLKQQLMFLINHQYEEQKLFFAQLADNENYLHLFSEQSQSLILKALDLSDCIEKLIHIQNGILSLFIIDEEQYKFQFQSNQDSKDFDLCDYQIFKMQNLILNKNIAEINQKSMSYSIEMIGLKNENENTFCSNNQFQDQTEKKNIDIQKNRDLQANITQQTKQSQFDDNTQNLQSEPQTDERYYDQMTPIANQKQFKPSNPKATINIEEMSQDQAVDLLAKVFQKLNLTGIQDDTTTRQNWIDHGIQEGLMNHTITTQNLLGGLKSQVQNRGVFASQEYCRNIENQKYQKPISQRFTSENGLAYQNHESVHESIESIQNQNKTIQSTQISNNFPNNMNNDDCIKQAESLLKMFKNSQENNQLKNDQIFGKNNFLQKQTNFPLQLNVQQKSASSKNGNSSNTMKSQNEFNKLPSNLNMNQFKNFQSNDYSNLKQANNSKTNQKNSYSSNDFPNELKMREFQSQEISQNQQKVPALQLQNQRSNKYMQDQLQQVEFPNTNLLIRKNSIKSNNTVNQNIEINRNNIQRASINTVQENLYIKNQNRTIDVNHIKNEKNNNFDFYSCNNEKQVDPQEIRRKLLKRIEGVVSPISSYKNMQVCTSAENLTKRLEFKSGERTLDQASGITAFSAQNEIKSQNWHRMNSAKALPQKSSKFQTVDSTENSINNISKRQNNQIQKIPRPNLPKQKIYQNNILFEQQQQKQMQQNLTFRHRQNEIVGLQLQKQQQPTQKQQVKQNRYQQLNIDSELNNKNGDYESNQDEFISQSNQSNQHNFQSIESNNNYKKVQQFQTIQERPQKIYKQNFFLQQHNEGLKDNLLSIDSAFYNNKNEMYSSQKHQLFFNDEDEVPTVIMEDFN